LRTTNNLVFASLDVYKNTMQHGKENTMQILDINTKAAKTFEQYIPLYDQKVIFNNRE
jgi:hypothetical protein